MKDIELPSWTPLALTIAAGACLLVSFALFMNLALPTLTFSTGINYGEGVLADQARRVADGFALYPAFEERPWVIDNYPPVYPILCALIPTPDASIFFGGRLLSIMGMLISAAAIALIVRRHAGDAAALLAAAVFLVIPEAARFGVFMRVDSLALAFGLVGFHGVTSDKRGLRIFGCVAFFLSVYTRHSLVSLPLIAFAVLFAREGRRSLPYPLALVGAGILTFLLLDLLLGGRLHEHLISFNVLNYSWSSTETKWFGTQWPWRFALPLAAAIALLPAFARKLGPELWVTWSSRVALGLVIVSVAVFSVDSLRQPTPAGFFAKLESGAKMASLQSRNVRLVEVKREEIARARTLPGSPEKAKTLFRLQNELTAYTLQAERGKGGPTFRWLFALHLALAAGGVATVLLAKRVGKHDECEPVLTQGLLVALAVPSACMIGRAGSDANYLTEPLALFLVAAGIGLGRGTVWRRAAISLLLVGYLAIGWTAFSDHDATPDKLREKDRAHHGILRALQDMPPPILSEEPAFPPLAGVPMLYQPFMYRQIYNAGQWDDAPLVEAVRNQEFSAIIRTAGSQLLPDGQWGPPVFFKDKTFPPDVTKAIEKFYRPDPKTLAVEQVTSSWQLRWALWVPRTE